MKKLNLKMSLLTLIGITTLSLTSCKDDNPQPGNGNGNEGVLPNDAELSGDISKNTTLSKGNTYYLRGGVHVTNGAILKIEEGVTVKAITNSKTDFANTAYLLVEPGSKIEAIGTASRPVVFTSNAASPAPQDWGGVILTGKAPVNSPGGTMPSEMGDGVIYGGNDPLDNSGTLKYVRVEYTGKKQSADAEHNGFTFEGVGAGTTLEHLAVYKGADDGIEFFGGTVNLKYAVVNGAQDDLFDYTFGWSGKGQFWVGIQGNDVADRGIEADNNGSNNALRPLSNPLLSNVTLVGSKEAKTNDNPDAATDADKGKTIGLKLRAGTGGQYHNFVIYGFNNGVDVQHDLTVVNVGTKELFIGNSDIFGSNLWKFSPALPGVNPWATVTTSGDEKPAYMSGFVGTSTNGAIDPKTLDTWFDSANYKGAVPSNNNWVAVGSWVKL